MIVVVPGALGVVAVLAFIVSAMQSRPFRGGVETDGTVVSIETRRSRIGAGSSRRTMQTYAPRVEFADVNGVTHSVTSSLSGGVPPAVGDTVRISYVPADPGRARIMGDAHTRVGRYLLLVVGLGFLAISIALAVN
jgi:hypothetical protein